MILIHKQCLKYNKKIQKIRIKHKNKIRKETLCAMQQKVKHSQGKTIKQTKQSIQPDKKKVHKNRRHLWWLKDSKLQISSKKSSLKVCLRCDIKKYSESADQRFTGKQAKS